MEKLRQAKRFYETYLKMARIANLNGLTSSCEAYYQLALVAWGNYISLEAQVKHG